MVIVVVDNGAKRRDYKVTPLEAEKLLDLIEGTEFGEVHVIYPCGLESGTAESIIQNYEESN